MKYLVQAVIEVPVVMPTCSNSPEGALDACNVKLNTYIVKSADMTIETENEIIQFDTNDVQIKYLSVTEEPAE